jgi:phosphonopyruvate decarboxylase
MQNSGLGNTVNPITSLVHQDVYSIPMVLMIGWRGEPGVKDEPQHAFMGKATIDQLETLTIPYSIIDTDTDAAKEIQKAAAYAAKNNAPYALLVKKGTFAPYSPETEKTEQFELSREQAVKTIATFLSTEDVIVSTTGMASRELFETRKERKQSHASDFLTVGGMGCASSIALAVATNSSGKRVVCIDGDGAAIMHMGGLASVGKSRPSNLLHVVINNGVHGSTGGQPTMSRAIELCEIAKACGYQQVFKVTTQEELEQSLKRAEGVLTMIEVMTNKSFRKDLGRPTNTPLENKLLFMDMF